MAATLIKIASTKCLGVYLSKDLRWNEHVRYITNKANKLLSFLKRNLKHCTTSMKKACKSLIQPITEYCSSVCDCYTAKNIKQVETVQRRAARWVLSCYNRQDRMTDMLNEMGWKSLQSRRIIARLSMLYKFRNNLANVDNANLHPNYYQFLYTFLWACIYDSKCKV